jgi:hypothetical protein
MIYDREKIGIWFAEAVNHPNVARLDTEDSVALIYRGFKLEIFEEIGVIYDVRHRNLYSDVSKKNLRLMNEVGFIKACDLIMYERDLSRIKSSMRRLSYLENKKLRLERANPIKNKRRINGVKSKQEEVQSNYFLYVSRSRQLAQKLEL